jgi:hypothetical protein
MMLRLTKKIQRKSFSTFAERELFLALTAIRTGDAS